MRHFLQLFILTVITPAYAAEYRTFTSTDGQAINATVINFNPADGKVEIMREDNRKFTIPYERFSEKDQAYLTQWRDEYDRSFVSLDFMGISVKSSRVIFVIDISGSMEGKRWKKLELNLEKVIRAIEMPSDFNIITFGSAVHQFKEDMIPANKRNQAAAIEWLEEQRPSGSTNTKDALKKAFESESVETIVLLSDGLPTDDTYGIYNSVSTLQREREKPVTIHAISYQSHRGADFMKELAARNNGRFIRR